MYTVVSGFYLAFLMILLTISKYNYKLKNKPLLSNCNEGDRNDEPYFWLKTNYGRNDSIS